MKKPVWERLRRLREHAGMSRDDLAICLGFAYGSAVQRYEVPEYKKKFLPIEMGEKLAEALVGKGDPPIEREEVLDLCGIPVTGPMRHNKAASEEVVVHELDVRAASGPNGGAVEILQANERAHIIGKYSFPAPDFRGIYGAQAEHVRIIEVIGDSMVPELFPGQRIMVNVIDHAPTPPGIFVLWDGFGLVTKHVELIMHSDPLTVEIKSTNPTYRTYERTMEEAHIMGRVIGRWART